MQIKSMIMPYFARLMSSRLLTKGIHKIAETRAKISRQWPVLEVYLHPKDPWSFLLLQTLPNLEQRYKVNFQLYWLNDLQSDMFPEPKLLQEYALKDCDFLAATYELSPPPRLDIVDEQIQKLSCKLQKISSKANTCISEVVSESVSLLNDTNIEIIKHGDKNTWHGDANRHYSQILISNSKRQSKLGHYAPATIYFAGEWYWGLDRINHLENRLNDLDLHVTKAEVIFDKHLTLPTLNSNANLKNKNLTLYWSARSPYSYLALIKCIELSEKYHFELSVKPVLPMMMRNLPVPNAKKMYIFRDTKREANKSHINYGFVADPLGIAVVRCYSLLDYARKNDRYQEFLVSFSKAVNAEGVRAQSDKGLKFIVERAGLEWQQARLHLNNPSWRQETQNNLFEMTSRGLWGVPSLAFEQHIVWGQDRIPFILNKMANSNQ